MQTIASNQQCLHPVCPIEGRHVSTSKCNLARPVLFMHHFYSGTHLQKFNSQLCGLMWPTQPLQDPQNKCRCINCFHSWDRAELYLELAMCQLIP
eukprot:6470864-Amphidinium_carterae.2